MFSIAGLVTFFAGAKRWFTKEALIAAIAAIVVLSVVIGGAMLFRAGGSSAEARVNWKWLTQLSELARKRAIANAAESKRVADAAAAERDKALQTLKAELESRASLEAELAKLKENPVVYTRDERRRLFK